MDNFPKSLTNAMYDNNVRFAQIMHIPTLSASINEEVSEEFQDFLSSASEGLQCSRLIEQRAELKPLLNKISKCNDLESNGHEFSLSLERLSGDFQFLVQLEAAIPHSFEFNDKGECKNNRVGGRFYMVWILVKDMVDAAKQANEYAEKMYLDELSKAKVEQGITSK